MKKQKIKFMNIKEFQAQGFLQEANRLFFHPLGIALGILHPGRKDTGKIMICEIWDYRGDPEGMVFKDGYDATKAKNIETLRKSKIKARAKLHTCSSQGIQHRPVYELKIHLKAQVNAIRQLNEVADLIESCPKKNPPPASTLNDDLKEI